VRRAVEAGGSGLVAPGRPRPAGADPARPASRGRGGARMWAGRFFEAARFDRAIQSDTPLTLAGPGPVTTLFPCLTAAGKPQKRQNLARANAIYRRTRPTDTPAPRTTFLLLLERRAATSWVDGFAEVLF